MNKICWVLKHFKQTVSRDIKAIFNFLFYVQENKILIQFSKNINTLLLEIILCHMKALSIHWAMKRKIFN